MLGFILFTSIAILAIFMVCALYWLVDNRLRLLDTLEVAYLNIKSSFNKEK